MKVKMCILFLVPMIMYMFSGITLTSQSANNAESLTRALQDVAYESTTLILNADRDMYQALSNYERLMSDVAAEERERLAAEFEENVSQAADRMQQAQTIIADNDLSMLKHAETGYTLQELGAAIQANFGAWSEQTAAAIAGQQERIDPALLASFEAAREPLNEVSEALEAYATEHAADMLEETRDSRNMTIAIMIPITLLLTLYGVIAIIRMNRAVTGILHKTEQLSAGNLTLPPDPKPAKDEMGRISRALDGMAESLRGLVGSIVNDSRKVGQAAETLAASSKESAEASEHIAAHIQEVSSGVESLSMAAEESSKSIHEVAQGVQRIAESTSIATESSAETSKSSEEGQRMLETLAEQVEAMVRSSESLDRIIEALTEKSEQIGRVADEISQFANQTNILSLNASIESARAGEHGKGFAVVATEIRKLAFHSLQSAEGINGMIEDTRREIAAASELMNTTMSEAEKSRQVMDEVRLGFEKIRQSVRENEKQVLETSAVTQQMSASSEEIAASMEHSVKTVEAIFGKTQSVAAATEEQLALAESITDASSGLKEVVANLNRSVSRFQV